MNTVRQWIPILVSGGLIFLTSELTWGPVTTPWFSAYVGLDTIAHLTLYLFFGLFVARFLSRGLGFRSLGALVLTTFLCTAFGVADEVHQMSVYGRNAELHDIAADLAGGLAGGLVYLVLSGSGRWIREFLISSEIDTRTMVKRSVVALSFLAGTCVLSTIYAGTVFDFGRAIAVEGWVQVSDAIHQHRLDDVPVLHGVNGIVRGAWNVLTRGSMREPVARPHAELRSSDAVAKKGKTAASGSKTKKAMDVAGWVGQEPETGVVGSVASTPVTPSSGTDDLLADTDSPPASAIPATVSRAESRQRPNSVNSAGAKMSVRTRKGAVAVSTAPRDREPHERPHLCYSVAVIAHPGNRIKELTLDQLRRLFSGEYDNWSQVGGSDVPVMVVTAVKRSGSRTRSVHMHVRESPLVQKVSLPFASLVVPAVAQSQGALGLLPVRDARQRAFVSRQEGFHTISIKTTSSAVPASPGTNTLNTCANPLSHVPRHNGASPGRVPGASQ